MAAPMTPDQWLKALREEGVTDIVEMPGWRRNNRNHVAAWGPVHATMVHHTAGEGSGLPNFCFNGTSDLPGPLCHDFLARSGRLYLVGNGRTNHAGRVASNAYDAVLNERATHPKPGPDALDGNTVSYGLEVENSGAVGRDWPAKQYDVAVRVEAARCRHHGWSADSVWAHKEATRRKPVDPRIPMDQFRDDVAERLAHDVSWNPGDTNQEEDMPITDADAEKIARKVLTIDGVIANPVSGTDNSHIALMTSARNIEIVVRRLETKEAAQTAVITALASKVGSGDDTAEIVAAVQKAIADAVIKVDVDINRGGAA